jgi:hypothetical protein
MMLLVLDVVTLSRLLPLPNLTAQGSSFLVAPLLLKAELLRPLPAFGLLV